MKDPICPHCKAKASEHPANECFNAWLDDTIYGEAEQDLEYTLCERGRGNFSWRLIREGTDTQQAVDAHIRDVIDFSNWQHAGPLLEEMKADLIESQDDAMWDCDIEWAEDDGNHVYTATSKSPTLAICIAYLIWKANQAKEVMPDEA